MDPLETIIAGGIASITGTDAQLVMNQQLCQSLEAAGLYDIDLAEVVDAVAFLESRTHQLSIEQRVRYLMQKTASYHTDLPVVAEGNGDLAETDDEWFLDPRLRQTAQNWESHSTILPVTAEDNEELEETKDESFLDPRLNQNKARPLYNVGEWAESTWNLDGPTDPSPRHPRVRRIQEAGVYEEDEPRVPKEGLQLLQQQSVQQGPGLYDLPLDEHLQPKNPYPTRKLKTPLNRPKSRKIVRWNHEKVVLSYIRMIATLIERGVEVPYTEAAKAVGETVTGEALKQHLIKERIKLIDRNYDPGPWPKARGSRRPASGPTTKGLKKVTLKVTMKKGATEVLEDGVDLTNVVTPIAIDNAGTEVRRSARPRKITTVIDLSGDGDSQDGSEFEPPSAEHAGDDDHMDTPSATKAKSRKPINTKKSESSKITAVPLSISTETKIGGRKPRRGFLETNREVKQDAFTTTWGEKSVLLAGVAEWRRILFEWSPSAYKNGEPIQKGEKDWFEPPGDDPFVVKLPRGLFGRKKALEPTYPDQELLLTDNITEEMQEAAENAIPRSFLVNTFTTPSKAPKPSPRKKGTTAGTTGKVTKAKPKPRKSARKTITKSGGADDTVDDENNLQDKTNVDTEARTEQPAGSYTEGLMPYIGNLETELDRTRFSSTYPSNNGFGQEQVRTRLSTYNGLGQAQDHTRLPSTDPSTLSFMTGQYRVREHTPLGSILDNDNIRSQRTPFRIAEDAPGFRPPTPEQFTGYHDDQENRDPLNPFFNLMRSNGMAAVYLAQEEAVGVVQDQTMSAGREQRDDLNRVPTFNPRALQPHPNPPISNQIPGDLSFLNNLPGPRQETGMGEFADDQSFTAMMDDLDNDDSWLYEAPRVPRAPEPRTYGNTRGQLR